MNNLYIQKLLLSLLLLTNYIMIQKENINAPKVNTIPSHGVIGKLFTGGALYFNNMKRTRFKKHYTYITTNIVNKKQYIGSRTTLKTNINNDIYLGSGLYLLKAVKKYGKHNFTKNILKTYNTQKEAFYDEKIFIKKYNTLTPNGYNISPTGGLGVPHCNSKKTQKIINDKLKIIRATPEYKTKRKQISIQLMESKEYRLQIKKGVLKYNKKNPEKIKQNKQKQKEILQSLEHRKKMSNIMKQYYIDNPDACKKDSEALKNYYKTTPSAIEKNSNAIKKYFKNHPEAKKLLSEKTKERQQKIPPEKRSLLQIQRLSKLSTRQKMSNSAKKRIIKGICTICNTIYYKTSMNQFNKDLCDICRREKYKQTKTQKS